MVLLCQYYVIFGVKFRKNIIWPHPTPPTPLQIDTGLHKLRARKLRYGCTKIRVRHWFLCVKIISICQCVRLFFCPVLAWPIGKPTGWDKKMFHWRVEIGLKNDFIKYFFLRGPWIVKIVNCFCPLVLSTCLNWELLIALLHRPLSFKNIRLPQRF